MPRRNPIDRLGETTGLDTVAGALGNAVRTVLTPGAVKNALHGVWLGHALHPALAQVPVGCFTGAALLDLSGDRSGAPARLIGFGLLGSVPAAAAGLADYGDSHEEQQRIGLVHAALNSRRARVLRRFAGTCVAAAAPGGHRDRHGGVRVHHDSRRRWAAT